LPAGTWFGVYKVENEDVWNKVKDGSFRGYSIEGMFEHRKSELKLSLEKGINDLTEDEAKEILKTIHSMLMPEIQLEGEQPGIASTYTGEFGPGKKKKNYIHPALIGEKK
jgi:hypothetical protein